MRKNIRFLAFLFVPSVVLVLAACGNQSGRTAVSGSEQSAGASSQGAPKGFQEYPIGDEKEAEGLKIAAVYFQPVPMEPQGYGLEPDKADIHLEADIKATPENKTGFGIGEWVPNLTVKYRLKGQGGRAFEGSLMPMNASDGPHYGANVKMPGAGTYDLTFVVESPDRQGFLLHTDKVTGVEGRFWREPIEVTWAFNYLPRKW